MYKKLSRFNQTLREKGWCRTGVASASQASRGKPKSKIHRALDAEAIVSQERARTELGKKPWKLIPKQKEDHGQSTDHKTPDIFLLR